MARPVLSIEVTADVSSAVGDMDKAAGAVKNYGDAASTAAKQSRDVSGGIESIGGVAGGATTGLRDMSDAVAMAGFPQLSASMQVAAVGLESLDGAATLYKAAQEGLTKAVAFFDKVLKALKLTILTNPIFIIAAVIVLIVVAVVLLYKNCETFRKIVDAAFKVAMSVIKAVWTWVKGNWPLLLAILTGPIGLAVLAITKNWDSIKAGAKAVWDWIKSTWDDLKGLLTKPFTQAWDVLSGIFDKIKSAVQSVLDLIGKIKIPKLPDLNPFSRAAPAGMGALAAPRVGVARAPAAHATTTAAPTFIINGALDPEGVARQIDRIMSRHGTRIGRTGTLNTATSL